MKACKHVSNQAGQTCCCHAGRPVARPDFHLAPCAVSGIVCPLLQVAETGRARHTQNETGFPGSAMARSVKKSVGRAGESCNLGPRTQNETGFARIPAPRRTRKMNQGHGTRPFFEPTRKMRQDFGGISRAFPDAQNETGFSTRTRRSRGIRETKQNFRIEHARWDREGTQNETEFYAKRDRKSRASG